MRLKGRRGSRDVLEQAAKDDWLVGWDGCSILMVEPWVEMLPEADESQDSSRGRATGRLGEMMRCEMRVQ